MSTVLLIGRWELLLLQRSGLAQGCIAAAFLLSLAAIWNGHARFVREMAAVTDFMQSDESRLGVYQRRAAAMERQIATGAEGPIPKYEFAWGPKKALWPTAWAPLSAILPPHELQVLNRGQTDLQRKAHAGWTRSPSAETTESPLSLLVGSFDLTFVVLALFPLLAIALTRDLISGEIETGMVGSLLCHPVSLRQFVLGKLCARLAVLIACWALAMVPAFVVVGAGSAGAALRFLAYAAAALLYLSVWLLICAIVNVRIGRSGATLVTLSLIWLLTTYAGPAAVDRASGAIYPLPSRIEYVERKRALEQDPGSKDEAAALKAFFGRHPSLAPLEQYTGEGRRFLLGYARREAREREADALNVQYEGPKHRRESLVRWFSLASPAIALRVAHDEAAAGGESRHKHYLEQVEEFHRESRRFFYPRIFSNAEFSSTDYDRIPRFLHREQPWTDALAEAAPGIASLGLWLVLTMVLLLRITRQSPPLR